MHPPSLPPAIRSRLALLAGLLTALGALAPAPLVRAAEPAHPSREQLRELQLLTFNCARDNERDDCDRAGLMADPLLDHPRLSGLCKDALWTIREEGVVVPRNSFERRDRLDRAGEDLMRFCPPKPPTPAPGAARRPAGSPPGAGLRGLFGR